MSACKEKTRIKNGSSPVSEKRYINVMHQLLTTVNNIIQISVVKLSHFVSLILDIDWKKQTNCVKC